MPSNSSRTSIAPVLAAVRSHAQERAEEDAPTPAWMHKFRHRIEHIYWYAGHLTRGADVTLYLRNTKSDMAALLYCGAVGLERSCYLHIRSALENLVRHCLLDSSPSGFVASFMGSPSDRETSFAAGLEEAMRLPHFAVVRRATKDSAQGKPAAEAEDSDQAPKHVFARAKALFSTTSGFVHAGHAEARPLYESVGEIVISDEAGKAISDVVHDFYEVAFVLLSLYHLGEYSLVPQPIRGRMLGLVRVKEREAFLKTIDRLAYGWVRHQRASAIELRRAGRSRRARHARSGLRRTLDTVAVMQPTRKKK